MRLDFRHALAGHARNCHALVGVHDDVRVWPGLECRHAIWVQFAQLVQALICTLSAAVRILSSGARGLPRSQSEFWPRTLMTLLTVPWMMWPTLLASTPMATVAMRSTETQVKTTILRDLYAKFVKSENKVGRWILEVGSLMLVMKRKVC